MPYTIRLAAITLCAAFAAGPAFAHAHLRSAVPAVDSTVTTSPNAVSITYTEAVEPKFSTIEVDDSTGKRVDQQDPHTAAIDGKVLSVSVPSLSAGTYKVIWHVTAVDTHKTEGTFTFTVK